MQEPETVRWWNYLHLSNVLLLLPLGQITLQVEPTNYQNDSLGRWQSIFMSVPPPKNRQIEI